MKIVASIEARMSSSRLPGKVLLEVMDKPMLELMIERVRRSRSVNELVVATTINKADDCIEELCQRLEVRCRRGSEEDVLGRVLEAHQMMKSDLIVELTGDCPLIDPEVIDTTVAFYLKNKFDYVSNCLKQTYPLGMETQVFSTKRLHEIERITSDPADREHVSLYFYEKPGRFQIANVESGLPPHYGSIRLTLDTKEDFSLIRTIFERLYPQNKSFTLHDILTELKDSPELLELNKSIKQKNIR